MTDHPPSDHGILRARAIQAADQLDYAASLIRDLAAELNAADNKIETMRRATEGRLVEALERMPGPFKNWMAGMVERARDDPNMLEGIRLLQGEDGNEGRFPVGE